MVVPTIRSRYVTLSLELQDRLRWMGDGQTAHVIDTVNRAFLLRKRVIEKLLRSLLKVVSILLCLMHFVLWVFRDRVNLTSHTKIVCYPTTFSSRVGIGYSQSQWCTWSDKYQYQVFFIQMRSDWVCRCSIGYFPPPGAWWGRLGRLGIGVRWNPYPLPESWILHGIRIRVNLKQNDMAHLDISISRKSHCVSSNFSRPAGLWGPHLIIFGRESFLMWGALALDPRA